jgi:protein-S-isoprenylcysteine O-methyltransferase Ste14
MSRRQVREGGGIAGAIGAAITLFTASLPFVVAFLLFGFLFVYAIVEAIAGDDHASPTTVLLGVVVIVAVLLVGLMVAIGTLGKSLTPRRRRDEVRD